MSWLDMHLCGRGATDLLMLEEQQTILAHNEHMFLLRLLDPDSCARKCDKHKSLTNNLFVHVIAHIVYESWIGGCGSELGSGG